MRVLQDRTSLALARCGSGGGRVRGSWIRLPKQPKTRDGYHEAAGARHGNESGCHRARLLAAILTVVFLVVLGTILALAS
ncbi:MAG: hypothetical protein R3B99_16505 [Polyangiales bacterium]